MKAIINGKVYRNGRFEEMGILYDERILSFFHTSDQTDIHVDEIIDAKGSLVVPGFIDLHIHGAYGYAVMEPVPSSLLELCKALPENGVTSFLPTTMTLHKDQIRRTLQVARNLMQTEPEGAEILGVHLEGPYIHPEYKGAQPEIYIQKPEIDLIESYSDVIRIVTLAPEMEGALELIEKITIKNILVSLGHTSATFEQALDAYEKGARGITHCFNAMTGLHHRAPGVVGAALTRDFYVELIPDGIHVHPALYPFIINMKEKDKIILITDSLQAAGLPDGRYDFDGHDVIKNGNRCTLADGTLAGSTLKLVDGLRNFRDETELPLEEVIPFVTENPARYLGLEDKIGFLKPGNFADFVLLTSNLQVLKTIKNGNIIFTNESL